MLAALIFAALQVATPPPASPVVSASPSGPASPSPAPARGFSLHGTGANVFIDQATSGAGATPPEGPAFATGNPNAPMSPYDWFSGAPIVPGVAGEIQYQLQAAYRTARVTATASFVLSGVGGGLTNSVYWGEPLVGPIDPHEGRSTIAYSVVFPTHAGSNDVAAAQLVLPYSLSLGDNDGRWNVSGGFFTPHQFDPFVFTPPALTSWLPSLNVQTLESVGPSLADLDAWNHVTSSVPLLGLDANATVGKIGVEATNALLPSPAGTGARMTGAVATFGTDDSSAFSADWVRVTTSGAALEVPTLFGFDPTIHAGAQGSLATSTLADQRETILGMRAFFHPYSGYDATVELGRAWYDAGLVDRPGSASPGDYSHVELTRHFDTNDDLGLEYYRFDPHYATAILPYGVPENVWGIAWAYPGPWLKSTFQLANNSIAGTNRVGLRAHADSTHGRFEAHAAYYAYRQVLPSTYANLTQTGFVEVDYLVEAPGDVTLGQTHGLDVYLAWHANRDTFSADFARDTQYRGYVGTASGDFVDMRYPQIVFADQHRFSKAVLGVAGYGRYSANGIWSTTPVSAIYGMAFLGAEFGFDGGRQQVLIELRRYTLTGLPSIPGGPPPTLRGTSLVLDHHVRF